MAAGSALKRIRGARLIDGLGDRPVANGSVLIDGSRIRQVGEERDVVPPEGAAVEEYNYPTGTLLPGLIDVHCHFNYLGDGTHTDDVMAMPDDILLMRSIVTARTHLEAGVTTARETGGKHDTTFSLREGIGLGLAKGPRLVLCGNPLTTTGGHMWQMGSEADGVDGVRTAVRRLLKRGADWIKVLATGGSTRSSFPFRPSYTVEELRTICDEAHNLGVLVGAHCRSTGGIVNSLDAGVDMIIHVWFREADGSFNFRQDVAERIVRDGTAVNSTLHVSRSRAAVMAERVKRTGDPADNLQLEEAKRNSEIQMEHTLPPQRHGGQVDTWHRLRIQLVPFRRVCLRAGGPGAGGVHAHAGHPCRHQGGVGGYWGVRHRGNPGGGQRGRPVGGGRRRRQ